MQYNTFSLCFALVLIKSSASQNILNEGQIWNALSLCAAKSVIYALKPPSIAMEPKLKMRGGEMNIDELFDVLSFPREPQTPGRHAGFISGPPPITRTYLSFPCCFKASCLWHIIQCHFTLLSEFILFVIVLKSFWHFLEHSCQIVDVYWLLFCVGPIETKEMTCQNQCSPKTAGNHLETQA